MKWTYQDQRDQGKLVMLASEKEVFRSYGSPQSNEKLYSIAWNRGEAQQVTIDDVAYLFEANSILPIMMSQSFRFQRPGDIVMWQFNREFYCIVNHDAEVGCVGFVFYGPTPTLFIPLSAALTENLVQLMDQFKEEFVQEETNKADMLRMLLVRLIILITRLAKKIYLPNGQDKGMGFHLYRHFNLQVEIHYRREHKVKFYANLLHKSPKTISNVFSQMGAKTPIEVIQDRITAEAIRMLKYTEKSIKEIANHLGFSEPSHFSKYIKQTTGHSPLALRQKNQAQ